MRYAFADSELAARRLALVAEVFAPSTAAFVTAAVPRMPAVAIDLGCGPGHSTHLLAATLGAGRTVGLDGSDHFLTLAQATATEGVSFRRHDVTTVPFPIGPADVIFCRFLLSHLADPARMIAAWSTQLAPGGLLLLDEVESIRTAHPRFAMYIRMVEGLLAHECGTLFVGPVLDALPERKTIRRRSSAVARLPVPDRTAAAMFALNLASWREHPWVRAQYAADTLERLAVELEAIAGADDARTSIEWQLRQIVLEGA